MSEARENPGGGVSAKERTGFTKTEKEQLKNEAQRDRYVGDREKRAERRNLLQRLFGSNKQTEKTIAHEEAHQMDRAITQEEAKGVSEKEARRRVYERPQFRLTGEVRSALDEVEAAIEKNSFGPVRERLQRGDMWEGVNPDDVFEINNNHISKLVADHARKLAEEGDGKHFAASVSFLHEYLSPEDFPDDLRPKIHDLVDQELIKK